MRRVAFVNYGNDFLKRSKGENESEILFTYLFNSKKLNEEDTNTCVGNAFFVSSLANGTRACN